MISQSHPKQSLPSCTEHGVFIDIFGLGILIKGESGIGKSELALSLIDRGHRLIADDIAEFTRLETNSLVGTCPPLLQDFLEVRGLGLLNIRAMYGDGAIKPNKQLNLIVNLFPFKDETQKTMDRLVGTYSTYDLLNVTVPEVSIPVAAGRNLSVLIESAVRTQLLRLKGYNPVLEFEKRQADYMEKN